jgi:hypothetical protein
VGKVVNVALHGGSSLAARTVTERASYCPGNQNVKESECPGTQNEAVETPTSKNSYGGRTDEEDAEWRRHCRLRDEHLSVPFQRAEAPHGCWQKSVNNVRRREGHGHGPARRNWLG